MSIVKRLALDHKGDYVRFTEEQVERKKNKFQAFPFVISIVNYIYCLKEKN